MEDWEIELRRKLESELPDGFYNVFGTDDPIIGTSKQGYINYMVAIEQRLRDESQQTENN